jgi:large subunit ribosomal protein L10
MTRTEKSAQIEDLKNKFDSNSFFYLTDSSTLSVAQINELRRKCFEMEVEIKVVKNTLAKKALESLPEERGFEALFDSLKGPTTVMFAATANVPAKILKEFRKTSQKPALKAAYIDASVYRGDDQINVLADLKSKEDLLADIVVLLQSPIKTVLGSLQSGQNTISGLLKALENRA